MIDDKLAQIIFGSAGKFVAIKVHFGERGNKNHLDPEMLRDIVSAFKLAGAKPFLTDTNVIYRGSRSNPVDHIATALENGWGQLMLPIIIADSFSADVRSMPEALKAANIILVASHFKGHAMAGFGGAVKNLAMGCNPKSLKLRMHKGSIPKVKEDFCQKCHLCFDNCPNDAITLKEDKFPVVDPILCLGCGECLSTCQFGAFSINYSGDESLLIENMYQEALNTALRFKMQGKQVHYINYHIGITERCDCSPTPGEKICPDIHRPIAGDNPFKVDKASCDLVAAHTLTSVFPSQRPDAYSKLGKLGDKLDREFQKIDPGFVGSPAELYPEETISIDLSD